MANVLSTYRSEIAYLLKAYKNKYFRKLQGGLPVKEIHGKPYVMVLPERAAATKNDPPVLSISLYNLSAYLADDKIQKWLWSGQSPFSLDSAKAMAALGSMEEAFFSVYYSLSRQMFANTPSISVGVSPSDIKAVAGTGQFKNLVFFGYNLSDFKKLISPLRDFSYNASQSELNRTRCPLYSTGALAYLCLSKSSVVRLGETGSPACSALASSFQQSYAPCLADFLTQAYNGYGADVQAGFMEALQESNILQYFTTKTEANGSITFTFTGSLDSFLNTLFPDRPVLYDARSTSAVDAFLGVDFLTQHPIFKFMKQGNAAHEELATIANRGIGEWSDSVDVSSLVKPSRKIKGVPDNFVPVVSVDFTRFSSSGDRSLEDVATHLGREIRYVPNPVSRWREKKVFHSEDIPGFDTSYYLGNSLEPAKSIIATLPALDGLSSHQTLSGFPVTFDFKQPLHYYDTVKPLSNS